MVYVHDVWIVHLLTHGSLCYVILDVVLRFRRIGSLNGLVGFCRGSNGFWIISCIMSNYTR